MYSKCGFVKKKKKNSSNTRLLSSVVWTWPLYRHAPKANSTIEFRRERGEEEEVKRIKKNPLHFGKEPLKLLRPKLRTSKLLRLARFAAI